MHAPHPPRPTAPLRSLARALTPLALTLALTPITLTACGEGGRPAVLSDEAAREAGLKSLAWMERRVGLMVESKASCPQMADALLTQDRASREDRAAWRRAGAQEWLIARAQVDKDFDSALTELIAKGDLVYSYCAFFEEFRQMLARGERG